MDEIIIRTNRFEIHILSRASNYSEILLLEKKDNTLYYVNIPKIYPSVFNLDSRGMPTKDTDNISWEYYQNIKSLQMPLIKLSDNQLNKLNQLIIADI
jgi:hypothetical protein